MPVVAAAGLEGDVHHTTANISQKTLTNEILAVGIGLALGPFGEQGVALVAEPCAELIHELLTVAHVDGSLLVGGQLRGNTLESAQGCHGHYLAVGSRKLIAGEDVTKEVRLQVVIVLRTEIVVERSARKLRLVLCAQFVGFAGIVPFGRARPGLAFLPARAPLLAPPEGGRTFQHLVQHAQRIQRARESRVGIELRESLLQFVDGHSVVECHPNGRL